MHGSDGYMDSVKRFGIILTLMLHVMKMDNCLMHSDNFFNKHCIVSPNVSTLLSMDALIFSNKLA